MRLTLAAVALFVALSTACASEPERAAPLLDRSSSASAAAATASTAAAGSTAAAAIPTASVASTPAAAGPGGTYIVQSGDYLARIAQDLGVSVAALSDANSITDPTLIYPGQVLIVPGGSGPLTPSHLPATAGTAAASAAEAMPAGADAPAAPAEASPSLIEHGIDRLPFELPAAIHEPLDELLARDGGEILAFGIVLAAGGVALYLVMWLVASITQLVRLAGSGGARGALAAVRGARAGVASAGRGLGSLSGASRLTPRGQALAPAGVPAEYADAGEYEADAAEALRHAGSVAAAPLVAPRVPTGSIAATPATVPPTEERDAAPRMVQRSTSGGSGRAGTAREALAELFWNWRRAALLDRDFYGEAGSVDATRVQAVRVLMLSTVVGGLGWALHGGPSASAAATLALLLGWGVQTATTHILATRGHYAPSNVEGLARAFAFALAPAAFLPLTMLPFIGVAVGLGVFGWILVATIVATERTLHLSITEALESTVPGWLVLWVAPLVAVQIVT